MNYFGCLKAELYKSFKDKKIFFYLLTAAVFSIFFYLLSRITFLKYQETLQVEAGFLELLCGLLPALTGLTVYEDLNKERQAGNFYAMLAIPFGRNNIYLAKLTKLGFTIGLEVIVTLATFAFLYRNDMTLLWPIISFAIILSDLELILIHMWIFMKYDIANVVFGFVEMLLAFLSQTAWGDRLWFLFPCAIPGRMAVYILYEKNNYLNMNLVKSELETGAIALIIYTTLIALLGVWWFAGWEGKKQNG